MQKSRKKLWQILIPVCVVLLLGGAYAVLRLGAVQPLRAQFDRRFTVDVAEQTVWSNTLETRVPQVEIYDVMLQHLSQPRTDGKTPKLLFVGFDGALASAVGQRAAEPDSAVGALAAQGGLWLGQCGGAVAGDQLCKTAPGWCSMFTGVWANEHGVQTNDDPLLPDVQSIFALLAGQGSNISFSFSWQPHSTVTYKNEAARYPGVFRYSQNDAGTESSMLAAINEGGDAVFGILEFCDHSGHATGYSMHSPLYCNALENSDLAAARLIAAVQQRMEQSNEDWMIIITTDHGGLWLDHYSPTWMESTTFFAVNKPVF
ncbi:MAG: hypothetical protein LBS96_10080 [Oscillospiraceae bacterium]|jgi:hypothetical protein|nr:hypothetical protein [Oscillospiraceae bacterium]